MAEPLILSGSSINTFLRCARQWEFAYVQRIRRPPSLKMALGTAAHSAVEKDLTHKMKTGADLPKEEVQETFRDEFVNKEAVDATTTDPKETIGTMTDSGIKAIGVWHDVVAPATAPIMVEQHVQFKIDGQVIDGTLDVVKDGGRVGDWKFVGRTPTSGKTYAINMVGYAIGYRNLTGMKETGVDLDHIVRTKTPKHVPISSDGAIPDKSIRAYGRIVREVSESIEAGTFLPTGLQSNACSWCGYKDICDAYGSQG